MNSYTHKPQFTLRSPLTVTGKKLIILFSSIYVAELIVQHWLRFPIVELFQLYPFEDGRFAAFQFFTHPFIQHPTSPVYFLLNILLLYFFSGPVERAIGTKRFLTLFAVSTYGGALCGLCFSSIQGFNLPFFGIMPSLMAFLVIFGMLSPEATLLLFFVIPVKAKFISFGTILILFLGFLSKTNPGATYQLGGILIGYLYFNGLKKSIRSNKYYLNYLYRQKQKKKAKFKVIDGTPDDSEDKPTYH